MDLDTDMMLPEGPQIPADIKEILDKHNSIFNTSGEHKIEEIFEGYEKQELKINA